MTHAPQESVIDMFISACQAPRAFVQAPTFSSVVAFIFGYDSAAEGKALGVFALWLQASTSTYSNLPWWSLVRARAKPNEDLTRQPSSEDDLLFIGELERCLLEYKKELDRLGREGIVADYERWMLGLPSKAGSSLRHRQEELKLRRSSDPT